MALLLAGLLYPAYVMSGDPSFKPLLTVKEIQHLFKRDISSTSNLTTAGWVLAGLLIHMVS